MKQLILTIIIGFSSLTFAAPTRVDEQCQIGGCSNQVCTVQQPKEDDGFSTTCEWKNYYECFKIPRCVFNKSANTCGWDQDPSFLTCLKEKKAPSNVISQYAGRSVIRFIIGKSK